MLKLYVTNDSRRREYWRNEDASAEVWETYPKPDGGIKVCWDDADVEAIIECGEDGIYHDYDAAMALIGEATDALQLAVDIDAMPYASESVTWVERDGGYIDFQEAIRRLKAS